MSHCNFVTFSNTEIQQIEKILYRADLGGIETRSVYVQYAQGIQPNVPACNTFIKMYLHQTMHIP